MKLNCLKGLPAELAIILHSGLDLGESERVIACRWAHNLEHISAARNNNGPVIGCLLTSLAFMLLRELRGQPMGLKKQN
jgi:hypothetical protein